MAQLNLNLPILGDPNATEDQKVRTALSDIQTVVNSLDNTNIAANADINGSKLLNTSIAAAKLVAGILPPAGALMQFAGTTAPTGFLLCEGQAVSRNAYPDLHTVLQTAGYPYGSGDGSTTFNIPDLRGRVTVGKGTHASVDALGENDGTAVANRRPGHSHTVSSDGSHSHSASTSTNGSHTHAIGYIDTGAGGGAVSSYFRTNATFTTSSGIGAAGDHSHSVTVNAAGTHTHTVGSTGGTTDAPSYVVVNYIIKT